MWSEVSLAFDRGSTSDGERCVISLKRGVRVKSDQPLEMKIF